MLELGGNYQHFCSKYTEMSTWQIYLFAGCRHLWSCPLCSLVLVLHTTAFSVILIDSQCYTCL